MDRTEICFLSIHEAARLIAARELSPVEVLRAHLDRIEETDQRLNAFITVMKDEAVASAERAEREIQVGNYLGPLHGIPIGSKIMRDFVPETDAAVTERFRLAGAIIIGKLQMHEFALGATSVNPHDGPAHNPWDVECVTDGSSGGSGAAVSAGLCMGALGSDTGGSVRIPAALCGIVGLKPTFGRVSRRGVYPLSWSLDTVGPMTRNVRDAALVLNVIAGYDPRDPSSSDRPVEDFTSSLDRGVGGIRIGIPKEHFFDVIDPEVKDAVFRAAGVLRELGASVSEVSIPVLDQSLSISGILLIAEAAEVHLDNLRRRADDIGADVRTRLETGAMITATDYLKAQRARTVFNRRIAETMGEYDILLAPTEPIGAPRIGQTAVVIGDKSEPALSLLSRLTRPFNICGIPTVSVPCGFTSTGMPIGVQLAGRAFDETTVLSVAHAYEQATEWHMRRPAP